MQQVQDMHRDRVFQISRPNTYNLYIYQALKKDAGSFYRVQPGCTINKGYNLQPLHIIQEVRLHTYMSKVIYITGNFRISRFY